MDAETVNAICDELATGKSLRAVCRDKGIHEATARYWLRENGDHFTQYVRAREMQADALFDEILSLADDTAKTADDRRIAIDARKWAASKLHGKYSDKLTVNSNQTVTHKHDLGSLDTTELEQLEAILAKSERRSGDAGEPVTSSVH